MFIQNGMMQSLTLVLLLVVATTMMFSTDWVMALLGLAFVPFSVFTLGRVGYLLRIAWMRVQNLMSVLTLTMEENLQGIRVVRAFASTQLRARQVRQGRQRGAARKPTSASCCACAPCAPPPSPSTSRRRWCSGTAATRWRAGAP